MVAWRLLVHILLTVFCGQALACPICFTGRGPSIGQKLDEAAAADLAPAGTLGEGYKVVEVIMSGAKDLASVITDATSSPIALTASSEPLQLLLRNRLSGSWTSLGAS